jgi:hypothetical protein
MMRTDYTGNEFMIGNARAESAERILWHEITGFVGVADNDWFAFLSGQQSVNETHFHVVL